jgi:hypothetical protein
LIGFVVSQACTSIVSAAESTLNVSNNQLIHGEDDNNECDKRSRKSRQPTENLYHATLHTPIPDRMYSPQTALFRNRESVLCHMKSILPFVGGKLPRPPRHAGPPGLPGTRGPSGAWAVYTTLSHCKIHHSLLKHPIRVLDVFLEKTVSCKKSISMSNVLRHIFSCNLRGCLEKVDQEALA